MGLRLSTIDRQSSHNLPTAPPSVPEPKGFLHKGQKAEEDVGFIKTLLPSVFHPLEYGTHARVQWTMNTQTKTVQAISYSRGSQKKWGLAVSPGAINLTNLYHTML